MQIYPADLTKQIGYDIIIQWLVSFAQSNEAKNILSELNPSYNKDKILQSLQEINEFYALHEKNILQAYLHFPSVNNELKLLKIEKSVLSTKQIVAIYKTILNSRNIISYFKDKENTYPLLHLKTAPLPLLNDIEIAIQNVLNEEGIVHDHASAQLLSIRKSMTENRKEMNKVFQSICNRLRKEGQLADIEENFINGRKTVAVFSEYKREVKGILLGQSAGGKISYVEPQQLITINNEKIELENQERKEIYNILQNLCDTIRKEVNAISKLHLLLIDLDVLNAKTQLAHFTKASLPSLSKQENNLLLKNAFHPHLRYQNELQKLPTIPFDIALNKDKQIIIISGPNAGGKSLVLKTTALMQCMFQSGLWICAQEGSELTIVKKIYADIGDEQSIENGLSTYSARLKKMNHLLRNSDKDTLFFIDEFGTGSDPDLGGALAEAMLDRITLHQSRGIVTTHFTNLKLLANKHETIVNACMLYNTATLTPLYKLHIGEPGSSFTFEVATHTGISKEIIDDAKGKVSKEKLKIDQLLTQLQKEKNKLIKQQRDLQKQLSKTTANKRNYEMLINKMEIEILKLKTDKVTKDKLIEHGKKLHQLTQEWNVSKNKKEIIKKFVKLVGYENAQKKLWEQKVNTEEFKKEKVKKILEIIEVGSKVKFLKSNTAATILSIQKERAIIKLGKIEIEVPLLQLEVLGDK